MVHTQKGYNMVVSTPRMNVQSCFVHIYIVLIGLDDV